MIPHLSDHDGNTRRSTSADKVWSFFKHPQIVTTMSQRTVAITGATGLLGRQVSRMFRLKGWNVKGTGYSRADGVDILKVDLQNAQEVAKLLDDVKLETPKFANIERVYPLTLPL